MGNSDILMIALVETLLVVFAIYAAVCDYRLRRIDRLAELTGNVTRGDKSMNALHTVYAATIASVLVLVDNSVGLEGHKVILIAVAFSCATYLFYLSVWFRNTVFFPIANRLRHG